MNRDRPAHPAALLAAAVAVSAVLALIAPAPVHARDYGNDNAADTTTDASAEPAPVRRDAAGRPIPAPPPAVAEPTPDALQNVGLDEKLGDAVPADLTFVDTDGNQVRLGDYLNQGKPVLLNPIYYKCPMLCGLVSQGLTDAVRQLKYTPGEDFTILTISFNPDETPKLARANADATFARLGKPQAQAGWHHFVGDPTDIDTLLETTGFNVKFQPETGEWAHPAAIVLLSPDGTITRYLANTSFDPNTLRRAIEEAGQGTVGSPLDRIVLTCLQFNHATGQYELAMGVMRIGAGATVLLLGGGIGGMLLIERRRRLRKTSHDRPTPPRAAHA